MTNRTEWGDTPKSVTHSDHSVIEPVRELTERAYTSGSAKDVDRQIQEAERNLATLKQEFPAWMASEFADMEAAWLAYQQGQPHAKTQLFRKAHDMRGQAATFGFPLAGRAADELCKLMDAIESVPLHVIEAHVQAIKVIIRDNVNIDDHPLGVQMIKELEKLGDGLIRQALRGQNNR